MSSQSGLVQFDDGLVDGPMGQFGFDQSEGVHQVALGRLKGVALQHCKLAVVNVVVEVLVLDATTLYFYALFIFAKHPTLFLPKPLFFPSLVPSDSSLLGLLLRGHWQSD